MPATYIPPSMRNRNRASAAKATLERRVANAPIERREQRWLKGWHNRIDTYLTAATLPTARGECK